MEEDNEIFFVGLADLKKKISQGVCTVIKACLAERACCVQRIKMTIHF